MQITPKNHSLLKNIYLEMPHVHRIKTYECSEEPDICFRELGTSQVTLLFKDFFTLKKASPTNLKLFYTKLTSSETTISQTRAYACMGYGARKLKVAEFPKLALIHGIPLNLPI